MKDKNNCFTKFFKPLNMAVKFLIILGFMGLAETVITIFLESSQTNPSNVAVRSVMSNIFGYLFGSQVAENSTIIDRNVQTIIAAIVAITSLIVSAILHWVGIMEEGAAAVEIRNLMFSSVGFLLSRAKNPN